MISGGREIKAAISQALWALALPVPTYPSRRVPRGLTNRSSASYLESRDEHTPWSKVLSPPVRGLRRPQLVRDGYSDSHTGDHVQV